jgi:protein-disulfide isomerase
MIFHSLHLRILRWLRPSWRGPDAIAASVAAAGLLVACGSTLPATVRAELAQTPRGQVTIVEFTDFECPFCRRMHAAAAPTLKEHAGSVRIVRKHVPLSFHAHAEPAARVYLCAEEQGAKTDELAEIFYTAPPAELALEPGIATAVRLGANEAKMLECVHDAHVTARLRTDGRAFSEANGEGVPLTYVGRTRLDGAVDADTFRSTLLSELESAGPRTDAPKAKATAAPTPATTSPAATSPATTTTHESAVPFIEDDYPRALAEARRRNVPLFVDAWAPWCHSCLSMREYTFTDRSLAPLAKDFVFLSVDTEKPENAAFVRKFPNEVWPTLYVVDAQAERAEVKWGGTATAMELGELLASARPHAGEGPEARAMEAFAAGNKAAATGELGRAEASYRAALSVLPAAAVGRERARIVEALTGNLSDREKWTECTTLALAELPQMPRGSSRATVLAVAASCAEEAHEKTPAEDRTSTLLDLVRAELAQPADGLMLADDRSGLYDRLVSAEEKTPDTKERARKDAAEWAAFLEKEANAAKSKEGRAVFDPHRLLAYTAAGREAEAIPMLQASEKDFPADYNPKARLAKVYLDIKDLPHARAYVDAAFAQVYGPRTLRVAALGASIAKAQGKPEDAKAFLKAGLDRTRALPLTAKQRKLFESTTRDLAALE